MGQSTSKPTSGQGPIWDEGAERALLACVILDPSAALPPVLAQINAEDFYSAAHRSIYEAIQALTVRGSCADLITIPPELKDRGIPESVAGLDTVQSLIDGAPVVVNVAHYIGLVAERSYRRKLEAAARGMIEACHNGGDPAEAARKVATIQKPGGAAKMLSEAILTHDQLEKAQLPEVQPILGRGLLARGDYGILYGPKGSGKSWLALDLSVHIAAGRPFLDWATRQSAVLVWSLELTRERLRERLRAISPGRTHDHLHLFGKDSLLAVPGSEALSPIPRLALQADQERVLEVVRTLRPGLVVIDPLGPTVEVDENKELPAIARFLLDLASRGNCAVLATHHPRKGDPQNPRDGIHEMRGASQLGDWACSVFMLKPESGLFCLKAIADPRHCATPEPVWLKRTDLGTFEQTDAPSRQGEARQQKMLLLKEALQERGALTSAQAATIVGDTSDGFKSTRNYLMALGATAIRRGRNTTWILQENPESRERFPEGFPDGTQLPMG